MIFIDHITDVMWKTQRHSAKTVAPFFRILAGISNGHFSAEFLDLGDNFTAFGGFKIKIW